MSPILYRTRYQAAKTFLLWFATAAIILFLLRDPALTAASCFAGVKTVVKNVLPAVFPSMILAGFLGSGISGGGEGKKHRLLTLPPLALPVIGMGLFAGFPTAAKLLTDLYSKGALTKKQAERLLCCCNFCSPSFLVAAVGAGIYRRPGVGWLMWGCQTLLSLLALLLLGLIDGREEPPAILPPTPVPRFRDRLTDAVKNAVTGFAAVGGWILFFSIFAGVADAAFVGMGMGELPRACLWGMTELSGGVRAVSALAIPLSAKSFLLALTCGWSGCCVLLQILSFLPAGELSLRRFFRFRLLFAPLLAGFFTLTLFFCGIC